MKKFASIVLALALLCSAAACSSEDMGDTPELSETPVSPITESKLEKYEDAAYIIANEDGSFDGSSPEAMADAVDFREDIIYYEEGHDFTYGEGTAADEHGADEAAMHTVVHISKPGTYVLSGKLPLGQVAVDLGDGAKDDPEAVVTLVLNNFDINCSVAPAIIFYNVYECSGDEAKSTVDTTKAGANVIIADGSINNVNGSYVAKIYESVELSADGEEVVDSKKLHKYDGAFYSKMSMNIDGEEEGSGILNIIAENEGLDSEMHLTINSGIINIESGNDGINTNEDGISVTTINGGQLNIICNGSTGEGDGIDSNGWLVINGGSVRAQACATSGDAGIDSDMGILINGGDVIATGNMLDHISDSKINYAVFEFTDRVSGNILLKNSEDNNTVEFTADNDFTYLIAASSELTAGDYSLWLEGTQLCHSGTATADPGEPPTDLPEGFEPPELPERIEAPEGTEKPDPEKAPPNKGDFEPQEGEAPPDDLSIIEDIKNRLPTDFAPPEGDGKPEPGMGKVTVSSGAPTDVFSITEGSNHFINVAPVE